MPKTARATFLQSASALLGARAFGPWAAGATYAALLAICGIFAVTIYDSRDDTLREANMAADNLSAALTQDIARNIEVIDLSLQSVVDGVADPEIMAMKPAMRRLVLFDRAAGAKYLGTTLALDDSGRPFIASDRDTVRAGDFSDREYFTAHRVRSDLGLYISEPFVSRLSGEWSVAMSRRINRADGSFGGVAVATLRLAYLKDLFGRMGLGRNGSLTLFRNDGTIIMREPYIQAQLGRSVAGSAMFRMISAERSGRFEATSEIDGARRLYVFRHVGDLPLIQSVGISVDDIFAAWRRKAVTMGATLLILCSIVVGLISVLNVQLRRRGEAEAALAALALTDKLTGLANRRGFDETLAAEWRRAGRDRTPLSLLMLDADSFKSYNDRYGHLAGDHVLESIGGAVSGSLRRPADRAARYGGEEFAVLLPDTDAAGAFDLAEAIRIRVLDAAEPHAGSPHRVVTLSIGVATTMPTVDGAASELVAAADAALYGSKWSGRNRTTLAGTGSPEKLAA